MTQRDDGPRMIELNCPRCGGPLTVNTEHDHISCPFCNYQALIVNDGKGEDDIRLEEDKKANLEAKAPPSKTKKMALLLVGIAFLAVFAVILASNRTPVADPMAFAEVHFKGINGQGTAELEIKPAEEGEIATQEIFYSLEPDKGLSNGDKVELVAESGAYRLEPSRKTWVVSGLVPLVKDIGQIEGQVLGQLASDAEAKAKTWTDQITKKADYTVEPVKMVLFTKGETENRLYYIFAIHGSLEEGGKFTLCGYQDYDQVVGSEGDISLHKGSDSRLGQVKTLKDDQGKTLGHIFAYLSLDEVMGEIDSINPAAEYQRQERDDNLTP